MDSGGKKNQDDMVKFEEFLKTTKLLKSTDLNDRFIELVLFLENDRLFYGLQDENIKPETVKNYLCIHENKIKEAYERKSSFENFKKHVANVVFSFKEANDVKVFSEKLCEEEKTKFFSIFPMENADLNGGKVFGIVTEQRSALQKGFEELMQLFHETVSGPRVDLRHIGIQQVVGRAFVGMCKFIVESQNIIATQLGLIQQANERADRLQSEKDDLNKQVSEVRGEAAVATARVGEIERTVKAQDTAIETQKQSIEMQKAENERLRQENEKNRQENEKNKQENLQQQQQLDKQKKELEEERAWVEKLRQEVEKQKKENEEQLKKIETYNRINKTLTRQFGTSFSRSCQNK